MRILHIADIHLDRPFVGLSPEAARQRRRGLWETFVRCLDAAREHEVHAVTIGGDLWEDENVADDTRRSVAHELGRLGRPVLIAAGNHDPLLPGGNYERTDWPSNVFVFPEQQPVEHALGEVRVWGVSWGGGSLSASFLDTFAAPDDGRAHVLLLHGTAIGATGFGADGAHCPFRRDRVRACGFALCLAGHIHAANVADGVVYPGSPEPLGWGETGRHCYALVEVEPGREPRVELRDVASRRYEVRAVDCSGAASSAEVDERVAAALDPDERPETLCLRLELRGEVDPACEIDSDALESRHGERYAALEMRDSTTPAYDLDALARQDTARGHFVRRLRERIEAEADERERRVLEAALLAGLRAMDGREQLL